MNSLSRKLVGYSLAALLLACQTKKAIENPEDYDEDDEEEDEEEGGEELERLPFGIVFGTEGAELHGECVAGGADSCALLGRSFQGLRNRTGITTNPKAASFYYRKGCESGSVVSCFSLALQLDKGDGVAKDKLMALSLYQRVCKSESEFASSSCNLAALILFADLNEQFELAKELAARGCTLNPDNGCGLLFGTFGTGRLSTEKAPTGVLGFDFGITKARAKRRCKSLTGTSSKNRVGNLVCELDTPVPGLPRLSVRSVAFEFCKRRLCNIHIFIPSKQMAAASDSVFDELASRYGPPTTVKKLVPKQCSSNDAVFLECLRSGRVSLFRGWLWETNHQVAANVHVWPNDLVDTTIMYSAPDFFEKEKDTL